MASVLVAAVVLVATSNPGPAQVNDTRAAALASWSLGTQGELALPEPWPASRNYWGVETPDGRVHVNRFPGVALWAAPAYAVHDLVADEPAPAHPFLVDLRPAAWTSALTVVAALVVAHLLLRREVGPAAAGAAVAVLGAGTAVWSVAADALWPHGPAALLLLTVLWGWRAGRWPVVAVASAGAVLVRPHLAVALVVLAAWAGWASWRSRDGGVAPLRGGWSDRARDGATAVAVAVGTAVGTALLSLYSWRIFGVATPTAGYDVGGHLGGLVSNSPWQTISATVDALVGRRGVLRFSPVLVVAALAAIVHRRALPPWTVASAVAGTAFLLVQVRAVGSLGGAGFFGPRISLEAVTLAAPALAIGAVTAWHAGQRWRMALAVAAVVSVAIHAYGATVRSITPAEQARWVEIDATVRRDFGDLRLGDVDLRELPPATP